MKAFDRIIGYREIKSQLIVIADTLKNREAYRALGVDMPRGLLLYGEPGVGKSLMAKCLIEASGLSVFTCRKTEPNGEFVKTIKNTFDRASQAAPSIVFLDDMDKFANGDQRRRDCEEYVTVQACIDETKGRDVFVLATANDTDKLPDSLMRAGRFDRVIEIEAPEGKDAEDIIKHYLSRKKMVSQAEHTAIAAMLKGKSCAALETVINEAGIIAGYRREECITNRHIIEACLQIDGGITPGAYMPIDLERKSLASRVVYHEAGHATAAELLSPGSVLLAAVYRSGDGFTGFVRAKHDPNDCDALNGIMVDLGGRAATMIKYGEVDLGCLDDLCSAFGQAHRLTEGICYMGLAFFAYDRSELSQEKLSGIEAAVTALVESEYQKVQKLLTEHRPFFEAMAQAIADKGILTAEDIRVLREEYAAKEA
ncbi:MAG: AAA family ATPase [Clostridia bacterium]|nr:AAA family ATPase [Clostridia bacterium]